MTNPGRDTLPSRAARRADAKATGELFGEGWTEHPGRRNHRNRSAGELFMGKIVGRGHAGTGMFRGYNKLLSPLH
jgi:hypothetical protein